MPDNDPPAPLVPVDQRQVAFYGDTVIAVQVEDGTIWVPLRPIVEHLGLDWPSQYQRIKRDRFLRKREGVVIMTTPGGPQRAEALPLKILPGWLFKIQVTRVRAELQAKIERYQEDCYEVLWNAFKGEILPAQRPHDTTSTTFAVEQARAVLHLTEQHALLDAQVQTQAGALHDQARAVNARLQALELRLGLDAPIEKPQIANLVRAVHAVAGALTDQDGRNHIPAIFAEMYERFGISSYAAVSGAQYHVILAWLVERLHQVEGSPA